MCFIHSLFFWFCICNVEMYMCRYRWLPMIGWNSSGIGTMERSEMKSWHWDTDYYCLELIISIWSRAANKFEDSKVGYHLFFFSCREPIADAYILICDVISRIRHKEQSNHSVLLACGWWEDSAGGVWKRNVV